jgi:hypothetical protein
MTIYTHYVYWIHLPEHNDYYSQGYIGVSNNPKRRFREHLNVTKFMNEKNPFFTRILQKYSNILVQTLLYQGTEESCYLLEEELRPNKNIAWNAAKGGFKPPSKVGWKPTKETLSKRSKSLKGIPRTEEWCNNLSLAKQGSKNGMYGKKIPWLDSRKILIIQTKNKNKIDNLILLFKLLNAGESIRNISKSTGFATSTVCSIKNNPKLHFEAFPILKQFETC